MGLTQRTFVTIQWFKRGARWPNGEPRMCDRCNVERTRSNRATMTAIEKDGAGFRMPVAYCQPHIPEGLVTD